MKDATLNKDLVAHCGLHCGACGSYLEGRCRGCHENVKAGRCPQRKCCAEHHHGTGIGTALVEHRLAVPPLTSASAWPTGRSTAPSTW